MNTNNTHTSGLEKSVRLTRFGDQRAALHRIARAIQRALHPPRKCANSRLRLLVLKVIIIPCGSNIYMDGWALALKFCTCAHPC